MRIGIAQINTTVGDLSGNRSRMEQAYGQLVAEGVRLVVFPEMVISGYPPRDLLLKRRFLQDCAASLETFAESCGHIPALVGFPERNPRNSGRPAYNAVAICHRKTAEVVGRKCLLPTYDVFDEDRYFEAAPHPEAINIDGFRIAVTICEDLWYRLDPGRHPLKTDPIDQCAALAPDLVLNLSASPWHWGKLAMREKILSEAAIHCRAPLVYCNAVGGNDELIFDGQSLLLNASGKVVYRASAFAECLAVVDTDPKRSANIPLPAPEEGLGDLHQALVLGLRDYLGKSGFDSTVIGLSGGIDSAVTATIAADAVGPDRVLGISLPSEISSSHSVDDACELARLLGIRFETLPIASLVKAARSTLQPLFEGLPEDVTEENIQARARGLLLMAVSNKHRSLLLTTGNKSEMAVGYCTLYGDMAGGLAVLSDVPKTRVFALARHLNCDRLRIPVSSIEKPPSAELRPDQKDEDSLPPYEILDDILARYIEQGESRAEIIEAGFDETVVREVLRKVDLNEYKRKQAAPGLKLTPLAFGIGRRIPIVQRYVDGG